MRTITFLFLILAAFVVANAQSNIKTPAHKTRYVISQDLQNLKEDQQLEVRLSQYNLRKIDKNNRIAEFTLLDAIRIENFLMKNKNVLSCETHSLDKTAKIATKSDFDYKALIPEIEKMGYVVTGMRSTFEKVTFAAKSNCQDKALNATANVGDPNCHDCGKQQLKQDILTKFKDADYGGATLINFDSKGATNTAVPVNTSIASDQD